MNLVEAKMLQQIRLWLFRRHPPVYKELLSFLGDYCHNLDTPGESAWLAALRPLFLEGYAWAKQREDGGPRLPSVVLVDLIFALPSVAGESLSQYLREGLLHECLVHPGMVAYYSNLNRQLDGKEFLRLSRSPGIPLSREMLLLFCSHLSRMGGELATRAAPLLRASIIEQKHIHNWTWRNLYNHAVIPELSWLVRIPDEDWPLLACTLPNPAAREFLRFLMLDGGNQY
jgi:hypothetical protein